jgi:hypothetical protein
MDNSSFKTVRIAFSTLNTPDQGRHIKEAFFSTSGSVSEADVVAISSLPFRFSVPVELF